MSSKVLNTVNKVENLVSEVVALQKAYVEQLCPGCEAPCCQKVRYLFSDKDILFLNLSGRKARWRRENLKKKGCWFLGPAGCILEPIFRPFICHRYICIDLETEMNRHDPGLITVLREKFRVIDMLRSQMWTE